MSDLMGYYVSVPYVGFVSLSERSIRLSTKNALALAATLNIESLAFPIIGGGTGGVQRARAATWMREEIVRAAPAFAVRIVHFGGD